MKLNGLENYFKTDENGEIVDFKQVNKEFQKRTPLLFALSKNKKLKLKLNKEQFSYLIRNSDLEYVDTHGYDSLILSIKLNKEQDLNFDKEMFLNLMKNIKLNKNYYNYELLNYVFNYNKDLNFDKEIFNYYINNCDCFYKYKLFISYLNNKKFIDLDDESFFKLFEFKDIDFLIRDLFCNKDYINCFYNLSYVRLKFIYKQMLEFVKINNNKHGFERITFFQETVDNYEEFHNYMKTKIKNEELLNKCNNIKEIKKGNKI